MGKKAKKILAAADAREQQMHRIQELDLEMEDMGTCYLPPPEFMGNQTNTAPGRQGGDTDRLQAEVMALRDETARQKKLLAKKEAYCKEPSLKRPQAQVTGFAETLGNQTNENGPKIDYNDL